MSLISPEILQIPSSLKELLPLTRKKQIGAKAIEAARTPPATLETIDTLSMQALRADEETRADLSDTIDDLAVDVKENLEKKFEVTKRPETSLADAWHAIDAWEHTRTAQTEALANYVLDHLVGGAKDNLRAALKKATTEKDPSDEEKMKTFSDALDEVNDLDMPTQTLSN